MRNKLAEVKFIIIDEISMVSCMFFYQVHQRLNEIFGSATKLPFAELDALVCRYLHQLTLIKGTSIYCNTGKMKIFFNLDLWRGFKTAELTEVMRQQGDFEFISLLNKIRVAIVYDKVEKLLKPRFVTKDDLFYPKHVVHMFAENCPVVDYNELMFNEKDGQTISLSAISDIPYEV